MDEKLLNREPTQEELKSLWNVCVKFVTDQHIICEETIYQSDNVIENAYDFIDDVTQITGFLPYEE